MAQKVYKTKDGQTIIANMMNDVTNVSFKEYILKFPVEIFFSYLLSLTFAELNN